MAFIGHVSNLYCHLGVFYILFLFLIAHFRKLVYWIRLLAYDPLSASFDPYSPVYANLAMYDIQMRH